MLYIVQIVCYICDFYGATRNSGPHGPIICDLLELTKWLELHFFLGPRIITGVHRCLFISRQKRTAGKSNDKIFDQFMDQYPISSERSVNREVTASSQLEVGCESFGVALEELCPLSLRHSQNGSDSTNSKDDNPEAYI